MVLLAGGGSAQLKINIGNVNPVTGFQVSSDELYGGNLITSLPSSISIQTGDGSAQLSPNNSKVWINISGTWKLGTLWIKANGEWKSATPYVKTSGVWH